VSQPAIRAENVGKRFTLHTELRTSLRERLVRARPKGTEFWAVRDATFEVMPGEALGIIGKNGAGKSTALKVLTGVFRPTTGTVQIRGRTAALHELGAGFHPELTGRENIRLNGSILGFSRTQIHRLMDDIIDFSGIEEFIDVPVKRYSTGMNGRLGFAIAAKLEPEILMIDEVLSVGDAEFRQKCTNRLEELRANGCSVVLVSHSLPTIRQMCDQALWLDHGRVMAIGPATEVCEKYEKYAAELSGATNSPGSGPISIVELELSDGAGNKVEKLAARAPAQIGLRYRWESATASTQFGFRIHNHDGVPLVVERSAPMEIPEVESGEAVAQFRVPDLLLQEGSYLVSTEIYTSGEMIERRDREFVLRVTATSPRSGGLVDLPGDWV
jgi:lipopolysaccharide transport system ATP-binding protein